MKAKKSEQAPASTRPLPPPTHEQVAALAHAIWKERGCPEGRDVDNWLEAERQLRGEVRQPIAADDIPADDKALEPDASLRTPIERELDRVTGPREQRSPTSL